MARQSDADVTEAIEIVDAADDVEEADEVVEVDENATSNINMDDSSAFDPVRDGDSGPNVYTVLMIISTVAYLAGTLLVLTKLKEYCSGDQWFLW